MSEEQKKDAETKAEELNTEVELEKNDTEDVVEIKIEADEDLDDSVVAEENMTETIKKLRAQIKTLTAEKQEYLTLSQRMKADYLNYKKEQEERQKEFVKYAKEGLIADLLPILGTFNIALGNKEQWEKVDPAWRSGVEFIFNQFRAVLETNGLKEINPIGQEFDPNRDDAVEQVKVETEKQNNRVVEVIQRGYELSGKVIQAPKVKVGHFE